ncbi:MAG: hypothetical protein ACFB0G_23640 [Leptolyngbyaceae cyanobacterium]
MTTAMAPAAAHHVAADLRAIQRPPKSPTLDAICFAKFGKTEIADIAVCNSSPRNRAAAIALGTARDLGHLGESRLCRIFHAEDAL